MKSFVLLAVLMTAFFSSHANAAQRFGFHYAEIRGADDKTEGCGRGSDGRTYCVKQSWCVPLINFCSWEFADSGTKKARKLVTKTQDDGSFKVVDVDGKKPEKSQESFVLDDVTISGLSKQEWDKLEKEENDFARLVREIQVKKAEQEKKRKLEEQGSGGGSQGGGSQGGGSQGGGSQGGGSQGGGSQGGGSQGGGSQGGGSQGGGSQGGGSQGGGSQGGGSQGGGSQGGGSQGGGSQGGGSQGGGSSGNSSSANDGRSDTDTIYYVSWWEGSKLIKRYGDTPQAACSGGSPIGTYSYTNGRCWRTDSSGQRWLGNLGNETVKYAKEKKQSQDGCKDTSFTKRDTGTGSFSVICTVKGSDISAAVGPSVSSTGSTSSNNTGSGGGKPSTTSQGGQSGGSVSGSPRPSGNLGGSSDGQSSGQNSGKNSGGDGGKDGNSDGQSSSSQIVGNGSGDSQGSGDGNGQGKGKGDSKGDDNDKKPEQDDDQDLSGIEKLILGVINAIEKMNENISSKIDQLKDAVAALTAGKGGGADSGGKGSDSVKDGEESGKGDKGEGDEGSGDGKGKDADFGSLKKDVDIGSYSKSDTVYEAGSCPPNPTFPLSIAGSSTVLEFDISHFCLFAEKIRFLVLVFAYSVSVMMISSSLSKGMS